MYLHAFNLRLYGGILMGEDTPLFWALRYLAHGYSVIPAHNIDRDKLCSCGKSVCPNPGKHPRVETWRRFQKELPLEAQVRQWWTQWPNANVAIVTGAASGIVVVDIDPRHGGDAKDLEVTQDTVTCLTGGGGQHLYYRHPGGVVGNRSAMFPGVDLRGDGGLVIAPPSNHELGFYRWEVGYGPWERELAPFPVTINHLDPVAETARHPDFDAEIDRLMAVGLGEGQRNVFLTKVAGHYFGQGETLDKCQKLVSGVNARACRPPLADDEVDKIVKSIYQRDQKQREQTAILGALQTSAISLLTPPEQLEYARTAWAELGVEGVFDWYKNISVGGGIEYVLELTDRSCILGESLLQAAVIKDKVLNYLDVLLPRFTAPVWEKTAGRLAHLAREERTGALKVDERVADWMSEYLIDAKEVEEELQYEALKQARIAAPILINGFPYLRAASFQFFLERRFGEKRSGKEVGNLLRQGGWEPTLLGDRKLRCWRLPAA